jgi:tRNA G18 (ribose-2'-O)-methylase SpoU
VVESERVVRRLIESEYQLRSVLLTKERFDRLADVLPAGADVFVLDQSVMNDVVGFALPRGVIGLADRRNQLSATNVLISAQCAVMLEDVVDPENLGAVFRHAACFGVNAVVLSPHAGDPLYRKTVRASMGWSLHVPWARFSNDEWPSALGTLRADGWRVIALTPSSDADDLYTLDRSARVAFLLGSEHLGLTDVVQRSASQRMRVPMADGVDSLNVATTAALALYEWSRGQR